MALKTKTKTSKLSLVPVKTETDTTEYTFEHLKNSLRIAQLADSVYSQGSYAEKDVMLTGRWESLPLYVQGDHMPKMELFKNFKKTVGNLRKE